MLLELEELELLLQLEIKNKQLEIKNKQQTPDATPADPVEKPASPADPVEKPPTHVVPVEKPATFAVPAFEFVPLQSGISSLLSTCCYHLAFVDHIMHPKVQIMWRHRLWRHVWSLMILFCAFVFQTWLFLGCWLQACGQHMMVLQTLNRVKVPSVMSLDCGSCVDRYSCFVLIVLVKLHAAYICAGQTTEAKNGNCPEEPPIAAVVSEQVPADVDAPEVASGKDLLDDTDGKGWKTCFD